MSIVKFILIVVLLFTFGGVTTWYFLSQSGALVATLWALPFVAILLALVFPGWGPGYLALAEEFGPTPEKFETERQYHLQMAKWFGIGALILPIGSAISATFHKSTGISVIAAFAALILGVPFLIKCIGSLLKAWRAGKNS